MAFGIPLRSQQTAVAGVPALVLPAGLQCSHMIGWPQELFKQSSDYIQYRLHSDISRKMFSRHCSSNCQHWAQET